MSKLAIISTNRNKYSETFIRMHIEQLPFDSVVYSDGYFPTSISVDRGESFSDLPKQKWWRPGDEKALLLTSFKEQGIDLVLAEYGPAGTEIMDLCAELNIPLVVHFHGFDAYRDDVMSSYGKRYPELFQKSAATIGVSRDMCDQLERLGCPTEKMHHVPYGIDTALFSPSDEECATSTFVACGRFVEKKAPLMTLEAFKLLTKKTDAELIMIGDGELLEQCKMFAIDNELSDKVTFTGSLNQREIANINKRALAFVQHSMRTDQNDSEGTPLAILEASASGLPIVSTRHAGIIDVVEEEITGYLVGEGDFMEMAACMKKLLNDKTLAVEMGRKGREKMLNFYKTSDYMKRLTHVLNDTLKKQ